MCCDSNRHWWITYEQLDTALNTIEDALTALETGNLDQYDISGQGW